MGRALWMVSVSINGIPRDLWTESMVQLADKVAARVLDGCGEGEDIVDDARITRTTRRVCSEQERRRVTEKYLIVR